MPEPTRVVLVKPGDVLILGNIQVPEDERGREHFLDSASTLQKVLDLKQVVLCEDDASIAAETPAATDASADYR